MSLIEDLTWRYATKKYDATKKVSAEDLAKILEATRLAPTSSGLQQYRIFVVSNQELKDKIVPIAAGQQIVADASHLLVFAAWDRYTAERIDHIYDKTTDERGLERGRFGSYTDRLKLLYLEQTAEENFVHTAKQAYIGFGLAIAQAAELKIDSTPMEGFNNEELDELLQLGEQGLKSVLLLPIGYRDETNDWLVHMKKVRNSTEEFVTFLS
ncbi:NAD(P)H-dependent oxidoreductase [Sphingobacterium sp. LRF_L2]|uniref:NAD(P)H-dependent oxidoreductase n=1 Tax=Sphingobacterium sp. LRF_L2 TaxID=3369421 RepID=UPI003F5E6271